MRQVQKAIRANYAINQFADDITRIANYLDKVENKGYSPAFAVRETMRTFGGLENMRWWERRYLTRVFPFYSWLRTITAQALRLPIDHPTRVAWFASLPDRLGMVDEEELPAWAHGWHVGGLLIPSSSVDPYSGVMDMFTAPGGPDPSELLRQTNPFLQDAYTYLTGNELEGGEASLPPGESLGGLLSPTRLRLLREELRDDLPSLVLGLGEDGVARYDTGDPVKVNGEVLRRERWDAPWGTLPYQAEGALRWLGIPYPRPIDIAAEREREERRRLEEERARERYRGG